MGQSSWLGVGRGGRTEEGTVREETAPLRGSEPMT